MKSFTLIELIIVITILAILAAVAIPTFQNMQTHAKDAATKGALGAMREALSNYRMNEIASGRQPGTPGTWPQNGCPGNEIMPTEQNALGKVMDNGFVADNPWARGISPPGRENWFFGTFTSPRGAITLFPRHGWIYHLHTCEIWANTSANGEVPCDLFCTPECKTENCY